jgi:hypothetical protein
VEPTCENTDQIAPVEALRWMLSRLLEATRQRSRDKLPEDDRE